MTSIVFNVDATDHLKAKIFLDPNGGPKIARYEEVQYPQFETFTEQQLSQFWRPEEIDLSQDKNDFKKLDKAKQHIFTSNLKRQTMLDTINGRGPNLAFLPITSLPEVEVWIETWGANETVHSRAYTHIIRNIYPDPSIILDEITEIKEILDCANDISKYYDDLILHNTLYTASKLNLINSSEYNEYNHKKAIWLAMNAVNALEGVRFYVSFACSWSFAENKTMEGNAQEIKLIARDENVHLGSTQYFLRILPKNDPDYIKIREDTKNEVIQMFETVIRQEKEWVNYLFQYGSVIGLNVQILHMYVDWIAYRRMKTIGVETNFDHPTSDPLPWTKTWISGATTQVAPQQLQITAYKVSDLKQDIDSTVLDDLEL